MRSFRECEAEANLATLGSGTGLAAGAFFWSLVSAQAANFLKDAVHFEAGLQALEGAVNRFSFADLNFGHSQGWGWEKGGKSRSWSAAVKWNVAG